MTPRPEQKRARRLFNRADFCALLLICLSVGGLLYAIDACTGWSLKNYSYFIILVLTPGSRSKRAADWWVRRAGLSQEGRHSETFPDAGAHASRALAHSAPIEVRRFPNRARRLFWNRVLILLGACIVVGALWLLTPPEEAHMSILDKALCLFMASVLTLICVGALRQSASDPIDLRVDAHGVLDGNGRSVYWEEVGSLKVTHCINVVGDLEQVVFYFLDANGEVLCTMSPPPEGQALLREVCAEPQSGSST